MDPLVPLPNINLTNLTKVYSFSALIVVLVIFSAFFSASETALTCCNRVRIKVKAENGSKSARLAMKLINMYDRSIITLLIGNNIVNILASSLATIVFLVIFRGNDSLASTISTIVMTLLILFFGEVIPKNMAKEKADKFILFSCYPLMFFHILFFPIMFILNLLLKAIKKIFKVDDSQNTMTEDEFQGIVETVEEEGGIDEEESDIIQAAVDFGDITVKDVLTPFDKVVAIDIKKTSKRELMSYLKNIEFSRIPVYDGTIDNVIGIFHVRKFLKSVMKSKNFSIKAAISEPFFVQDNCKLDDMVDIFKQQKKHLAIVKNNDEKMVGVVTLEDVLEELVGELEDESPHKGGAK